MSTQQLLLSAAAAMLPLVAALRPHLHDEQGTLDTGLAAGPLG